MQFTAIRDICVRRRLSYSFEADSWDEAHDMMQQGYLNWEDCYDLDEDYTDSEYHLECESCGNERNCDCEEQEDADRQQEESEFFAELGL